MAETTTMIVDRRYTFAAKFTYADEPNPIEAPSQSGLKENELARLVRAAIAEKDYLTVTVTITVDSASTFDEKGEHVGEFKRIRAAR